jgi:hypothetical protein
VLPTAKRFSDYRYEGRDFSYGSSEVYEVVPPAAVVSFLPKGDAPTSEADASVGLYYIRSQDSAK